MTGNSFSDSTIGVGQVKREPNDIASSGIVLNGTSDVTVSGNGFSGVRPKAISADGEPSRRVLFSNNVVTATACSLEKLRDSRVSDNLEDGPAAATSGQ